MTRNYGKWKSKPLGLPNVQIPDNLAPEAEPTPDLQQQDKPFNPHDPNGGKEMTHPEAHNPPQLLFGYTDEDYALVCNVWRHELGLDPIV